MKGRSHVSGKTKASRRNPDIFLKRVSVLRSLKGRNHIPPSNTTTDIRRRPIGRTYVAEYLSLYNYMRVHMCVLDPLRPLELHKDQTTETRGTEMELWRSPGESVCVTSLPFPFRLLFLFLFFSADLPSFSLLAEQRVQYEKPGMLVTSTIRLFSETFTGIE